MSHVVIMGPSLGQFDRKTTLADRCALTDRQSAIKVIDLNSRTLHSEERGY